MVAVVLWWTMQLKGKHVSGRRFVLDY